MRLNLMDIDYGSLCTKKKLEKHFVVLCCDFIFILNCCWNFKAKKSREKNIQIYAGLLNFFSGVHKQLRNFVIRKF